MLLLLGVSLSVHSVVLAQSTLRVNGFLGDPAADSGYYDSITAAVLNASAGDTILVDGLEDGGIPVGYTNQPIPGNSSSTGESFPIQVPPGIVITSDTDGPPIYVWHDATISTPVLFELLAPAAARARPAWRSWCSSGARRR